MSRKQQRRRGRPGVRLHGGKAGTRQMGDDFAVWGVRLLTHVLASEACSTDEAAEVVVEFPVTFPPLMVPVVVGQSCLRRVVDIAEAALRLAPGSRNALAFAAQVATAEGDHVRARLLMEGAWTAGEPDSGLRQTRAAVLVAADAAGAAGRGPARRGLHVRLGPALRRLLPRDRAGRAPPVRGSDRSRRPHQEAPRAPCRPRWLHLGCR